MTESPESQLQPPSGRPVDWLRVIGLLGVLLVLAFVIGRVTQVAVAEVGVYWWDDDLVEGGRYLALVKRGEGVTRMRWFGLAVSSHHDTFLRLPANGTNSTYSKVEHSWLTWALAFDLQGGAFAKIDVSKAWDDPANASAFQRRIQNFEIPNRNLPRFDADGYALSHIAGNREVIGSETRTYGAITDGLSNTMLVGTVAGNYEPWGKPGHTRDLTLGINRTPAGFGSPWTTGGTMVLMADGSVRELSNNTSPEVLRALASPAAGDSP